MSSHGTVAVGDVWRALDRCLPGYKKFEKKHNWWIYPPTAGAPPFMLPLGQHGKRVTADIQRGHVKRMARQFGITDCMLDQIPGL